MEDFPKELCEKFLKKSLEEFSKKFKSQGVFGGFSGRNLFVEEFGMEWKDFLKKSIGNLLEESLKDILKKSLENFLKTNHAIIEKISSNVF